MNKLFFLMTVLALVLSSCQDQSQKSGQNQQNADQAETTGASSIEGNYVTDSYAKRSEGYDWVAVTVKEMENDKIWISVRSRADKKKPTCTFDGEAYKAGDNAFYTNLDGKRVLFEFDNNKITIKPANQADEGVLAFYCSGGATMAGTYQKIKGQLDQAQVDKTVFSKVLRLQDVGFNVSSVKAGGQTKVTVFPFGLTDSNQEMTQTIDGEIVNAAVEDLNSDGHPELCVFTKRGRNDKGDVLAYTVLGGRSMIQVNFPSTEANSEINQGYQGYDEFTLMETYLAQRFPIFENGRKTGNSRQVLYKMAPGEAMPQFVVERVTELEM